MKFKRVLLALTVIALVLALWAVVIEPSRLVLRETHIALPNWPPALNGLRLAALADLHIGAPHMNLAKLRRIVELTNAQQPDVIVLLGDYVIQDIVGGRFAEPSDFASEFKNLRAKAGVYAVLGNHDRWYSAARVETALTQAGVRVLENDVASVTINDAKFWLAGLSDQWTGHPDITGTLAKITDAAPVLALTHNPDLFPQLPPSIALTLAGHTHGGQCAFPLFGRPVVPSAFGERYAVGWIVENDRHLFVTTGLGTSILPVRFRVPPEVALLQLVSP